MAISKPSFTLVLFHHLYAAPLKTRHTSFQCSTQEGTTFSNPLTWWKTKTLNSSLEHTLFSRWCYRRAISCLSFSWIIAGQTIGDQIGDESLQVSMNGRLHGLLSIPFSLHVSHLVLIISHQTLVMFNIYHKVSSHTAELHTLFIDGRAFPHFHTELVLVDKDLIPKSKSTHQQA